ncbi:ESCRT-II complex, vps25 subunit [Violaceomyces palustris]|uniref:ESCRT-II complex, vps25 subunit n=1 Tax=Violaceomyces palustris TaxID=1673888 RepID=A0ACD0P679_9BASI|nr:ESCRT-II complex, vps25 subunit [Violaceomyces palustris]
MAATRQGGQDASPGKGRSFEYPKLHSFPPFFTLQPNPTTLSSQLSAWENLILSHSRHHRYHFLDISPTSSASETSRQLFRNERIARELRPQDVRTVLDHLVKNGNAAWEVSGRILDHPPSSSKQAGKDLSSVGGSSSTSRQRAVIYWRKPFEWADLIYEWVTSTGQNKSIMTLFELTEGDMVQGTEFYNLPIPILRKALQILSQQGKAQIFTGAEDGEGEGVKFV